MKRSTLKKVVLSISVTLASILAFVPVSQANSTNNECTSSHESRYIFSWPIDSDCSFSPRGGTTKGGKLKFDDQVSEHWFELQEKGISKFERDRRAILAMQGGYKVSFDFLETIGFSENYQRDKPYQSWGTEYVFVVAKQPKFISLQHVMVMVFEDKEGKLSEPMVMKHWRQDWRYEDSTLLEYQQQNEWKTVQLSDSEVAGTWSQAVFQVDDSPRYESVGKWQHNASFSSWRSQLTRRPLPRREYSVRDDYSLLEGFNTHVVTRLGWRQVEENWKLKVKSDGTPDDTLPYLAKEQGMARYQPIVEFDFTPGQRYMNLAGQFWADVRAEWQVTFRDNPSLSLKTKVDGQPLFMPLFSYAQKLVDAEEYDSDEGKEYARKVIASYIEKQDNDNSRELKRKPSY